MSPADRVVAALLARLDGNPALAPMRVFDWEPARAGLPFAVVGQPTLQADDAVGVTARAGTFEILCRDGGERPDRLRALSSAVEREVESLPDDLGGGWRLVTLMLDRSQLRLMKGGWLARTQWSVRVFRVN